MNSWQSDLAQLARLSISEKAEDVRMFVARLVRKYRNSDPELADQMATYLQAKATHYPSSLRKHMTPSSEEQTLPVDDESRLALLKLVSRPLEHAPLLPIEMRKALEQLISERNHIDRLEELGLKPTSTAIFTGPPGVGKTLTAGWLASQLKVPFYILDLTAVMSSLLGKSGSNLRFALDFAKRHPCVLLLDEIDAIAKSRGDNSDIGELKRLVTVILQEVDDWPSTSLLLAATNHPELIDRALWRRFDIRIEFSNPDLAAVKEAIERFLGVDSKSFKDWVDVLAYIFSNHSFSYIERQIQGIRRARALGSASENELIERLIKTSNISLDHGKRIEFALLLSEKTKLSQHKINDLTGVSRDTIRKHSSQQATKP